MTFGKTELQGHQVKEILFKISSLECLVHDLMTLARRVNIEKSLKDSSNSGDSTRYVCMYMCLCACVFMCMYLHMCTLL